VDQAGFSNVLSLAAGPGWSATRAEFSNIYSVLQKKWRTLKPARSGWISSPAGQGFMSTQRREDRGQRTRSMERQEGPAGIWLVFLAWFVRAAVTVRTAKSPAMITLRAFCFHRDGQQLLSGSAEAAATVSVQSGYRNTQPVRQDFCRALRISPPRRAGGCATAAIPATRRLSLPLAPTPSDLDQISPCRPDCGFPTAPIRRQPA
jgi:hypothetical protein